MTRPTRVFIAGYNIEDVLKRSRETYVDHVVLEAKPDPKKKLTRSQKARGYKSYYRVYMRKRKT